ncbi:MAG TPA: hypothetical protein PLC81_07050 [Bacteroidales bacterium]|nr:hypothetical protein [Bacteroidales bacterium]HQH41151.1 hypothetical protein [Bacteroidales bacterium]HQK37373.1 hypothetical protein [Bacteroidales bacterium]
MNHDIDKLIQTYFRKKREGMDITSIRKELQEMQVPDDQIRRIIMKVDDLVVEEELRQISTQRKKEFNNIGTILLLIGLVLLLLKYLKLVNLQGYYVLIYAPIIAGAVMIWRARGMDDHSSGMHGRQNKRIRFR